MRSEGLLHAELLRVVAAMGHTDMLVIADCGLPIPVGVPVIDLALVPGVPAFLEAVAAALEELVIEEGIVASEQRDVSPQLASELEAIWPDNTPLRRVPHDRFKKLSEDAVAIVRTGEFTPYANVILVGGVPF